MKIIQLELPTTPQLFLKNLIVPALDKFPEQMQSPQAQCLMLAIAIQESGLRTRQQQNGPAHGFWQFEVNGCSALLNNKDTKYKAIAICFNNNIAPTGQGIYESLVVNDYISVWMARLLLWSDRKPIPAIGDIEGAWRYYLRNWRPGKPDRDRWDISYENARMEFV